MGTIKLKATKTNPYHKTGQIVEVEEEASEHLLEKGYFTLASSKDKSDSEIDKEIEKELGIDKEEGRETTTHPSKEESKHKSKNQK